MTQMPSLTDFLSTPSLAEAERLMTVCNSCRYCEGLCAVFPAMELRRSFGEGDLNYIANLCHSCGACVPACQFAPPHPFAVNVTQALARVRNDSYAANVWPRAAAPLFARNGVALAVITALGITLFLLAFVAIADPVQLISAASGPGAFFRIIPHNVMAGLFGGAFLYAILAITMSARNFWLGLGPLDAVGIEPQSFWQAVKDACTLRYLEGGKAGCAEDEDALGDKRRLYHHFTFYGFLLCFASTSTATAYHYLLGREAPYPWWDLPVVLGAAGGIGLVFGSLGLLRAKRRRSLELQDGTCMGMDMAFILMLFLTGLTGMALLLLRETAVMNLILAIHLGVVASFFLTMPYSKFVHGIYRFLALVRYNQERRGAH